MRLTLNHLACTRGDRVLFADLSISLARGDALLVRGPNGSGKTSLLRIIAGYLAPGGGAVEFGGEAGSTAAAQLHFLGHKDGLKPPISVRDQLTFWSTLLGGTGDRDAALTQWGLAGLADLPCGVLSAGQQRRLALARLTAVPRPLWLLDEPTSPLDEQALAVFEQAVAAHRAGGGIAVIATHRRIDVPGALTLDLGERGRA